MREASGGGDLYREVGKMVSGGGLGELVRVRELVSLKDSEVVSGFGFSSNSMYDFCDCA